MSLLSVIRTHTRTLGTKLSIKILDLSKFPGPSERKCEDPSKTTQHRESFLLPSPFASSQERGHALFIHLYHG